MTTNPIINALGASIYIITVVAVMTLVTEPLKNKPDTFFAPIAVLFVFTLSAAVMAFVFFYQPIILLLDGKKKQAVDLFAKTVAVFAVFTFIAIAMLSLGLI